MTEENTARYKALVAKHGLTGPLPLLERLDAVYTLMEEYGGVMRDRGLLLDKKDAEIASYRTALEMEKQESKLAVENEVALVKVLSTAIGEVDALLDAEKIQKGWTLPQRVTMLIGKLKAAEHAVSEAHQQRDEDVHVLEHARDEALRKYERAFDCHEEPAGCGGCVTCLNRKLDAAEAARDVASKQTRELLAERDGLRRFVADLVKHGLDIDDPQSNTPFWTGKVFGPREGAQPGDDWELLFDLATAEPSDRGEPGQAAVAKDDGKLDHLALSFAEIFTECDLATATRRVKARLQKLVAETKAAEVGIQPKTKTAKMRPLVEPVCAICGREEDNDIHMDGTNGPDDAHEFRARDPKYPNLKLLPLCADGLCSHSTEGECWDAAKAAADKPSGGDRGEKAELNR